MVVIISSDPFLQSSDGCHCNSNVTWGLWGPEGMINSTQCHTARSLGSRHQASFPCGLLLLASHSSGVGCGLRFRPSPAQPKSTPVDCLAKVREEAVASAVLSWASIPSTCKPSAEDWATSGTVQILIQQAGITSPSKSNYHTALTLMGTLRSGPGEAHKHRTGVPNLASLPKFLSPPCSPALLPFPCPLC